MEIGTSYPHISQSSVAAELVSAGFQRFTTNIEPDSFLIAMDRIYRPLIVCYMRMVAPPLHPKPRNAALILNYISKKVCPA